MVIKKCKICGKEFDTRGRALCCSPECSKENKRRLDAQWRADNREHRREYDRKWREANPEKKRESNRKWREANPEYDAQWRADNPEYAEQWRADNPDYDAQYYADNRERELERTAKRHKKIISELCEQYDGDLEQILENIPSRWQVREAQMQVWFGESYCDGIISKIKSTPVCEVTGEKTNDLVIHHLYSFNTHPELGNDPANMVRITKKVHKEFHKIYGYGDNTPEQWMEFLEKY